jgi:dienelactone hydrolase
MEAGMNSNQQRFCSVWLGSAILFIGMARAADTLPGTAAIPWPEPDLSARLMDGAHVFVERKIGEARDKRARHWNHDFTSPEGYERSVAPNRERFRKMIGVVDARVVPVPMEIFGEAGSTKASDVARMAKASDGVIVGNPALLDEPAKSEMRPGLVAETDAFRIWQVRWPVLDRVWSEGLMLEPIKTEAPSRIKLGAEAENLLREKPRHVIMVPDATETPEQLAGVAEGDPGRREFVRRLVTQGFTVIIPTILDRELYLDRPGLEDKLKKAEISHREWIYRQAFHLGRHIIGYEVQKVLAAVDWIELTAPGGTIGVAGWGDGGQLAFYAGACDTRITATLVGGYFQSRERIWAEPIDRNLFGFLNEFGDAEISSLFPPRALLIDDRPGGQITTPKGEFAHLPDLEFTHFGMTGQKWSFPFANRASVLLTDSLSWRFFTEPASSVENPLGYLQNGLSANVDLSVMEDLRAKFSPKTRRDRLFAQMEDHTQQLIRDADRVRDEWFLFQAEPKLRPGGWSTEKAHPTLDPANFIEKAKAYREIFAKEAMGSFDEPLAQPNPRSRKVAETEKWTAWDVVLDVYHDLFAWGTLVLPKDLKADEKRPVVVCQHGRNGLPRDTINASNPAYNDFAAKLAERGFITFAPHNLYRGEDRYRWLDRKANAIGCTLFSFIIPSHRQILDWLKTQPNVDPARIAFYGLSYGGETAMRVPPLLEDYAVTICSGDFNQWTRKVAATDFPNGFMPSIEWEMPYWNLGNTFDYSEMAALIFPRPFMVERGHHDRVSTDAWVAHEYAKVRWLYAQFGMADRTAIEFFQGGHSINGQGSFDFLHKHLNWPVPGN